MSTKPTDPKVCVSFSLDADVADHLRKRSVRTEVASSRIVNKALRLWLHLPRKGVPITNGEPNPAA